MGFERRGERTAPCRRRRLQRRWHRAARRSRPRARPAHSAAWWLTELRGGRSPHPGRWGAVLPQGRRAPCAHRADGPLHQLGRHCSCICAAAPPSRVPDAPSSVCSAPAPTRSRWWTSGGQTRTRRSSCRSTATEGVRRTRARAAAGGGQRACPLMIAPQKPGRLVPVQQSASSGTWWRERERAPGGGGKRPRLALGASRGGLLRPRQASTPLQRRPGGGRRGPVGRIHRRGREGPPAAARGSCWWRAAAQTARPPPPPAATAPRGPLPRQKGATPQRGGQRA